MKNNSYTKFSILFCSIIFCFNSYFAGIIQGKIIDNNGAPLPFASVYVKSSTIGTATNIKGEFLLELLPGNYIIVSSFIGYVSQEFHVSVERNSKEYLNITLVEDLQTLGEVKIYADNRDRAKEIMKEVRDKRSDYLKQIEWYQCKTYIKTALDKKVKLNKDSVVQSDNFQESGDLNQFFKRENLNLIESISITSFERQRKYKEHFIAFHDYSEIKGESKGASVNISVGDDLMAPEPEVTTNPYILFNDVLSCDFNFYENLIYFPEVTQKPLLSPIAETANLTYQYDLEGSFYEGLQLIYKIKVTPIFITDAAFSGFVYVEDSTWKVRSIDLSINPQAMSFCKDFHIIQNYESIENNGFLVPVKREISYTIKDGSSFILANTRIIHSDYAINTNSSKIKWTNEIKSFESDALDKDSIFWTQNRPIQLQEKELKFVATCDSLKAYFSSPEYYNKQDSIFNHINIWSIFNGVGRRNSFIKQEWYIEGVLSQIQPFGIGGYRHKLPGYYNKEFKNDYKLEVDGFVDYGFKNKDVKGKLGVGLTYVPKKFVRTYITIGDYYDMINNFASLSQTFSRSNYVRNVNFSIAQRMEIINGLFAELTLNFSDQRPINNLQLENWSNELFGTLNIPVDFERYIKSELVLDIKYRIKQKYMYKGNKKVILESRYPVIVAKYKKGVPGLLNSEVNYDYIELGASHELKLKRFGTSAWKVTYGNYINKNGLRVLEHKYFRGSDQIIFSNPLRSFQLLGPTLSTANNFFQANYMHHFEGSILNKVPYLNRLKLELAGGIGILMIEDDNFKHIEAFAGIERMFKIRQQLFRIGTYAVTSVNTVEQSNFTFKVGVNMYNAFSRRWDY